MDIEEYIMDREEFLTMVIPEYEDVVTFYEDYGILLREWGLNNDILDEDIDENLATIIDSLDFTEMFSLYEFSINVNITILINRLTDILIDLDLYKEIDIDKYYVESVLNKILPYKITTYEFN